MRSFIEFSLIIQLKGADFPPHFKFYPVNAKNFFVLEIFLKQKKTVTADKGQTISRPSCLTVTVTRIFHRFTSSHWLSPDYFR